MKVLEQISCFQNVNTFCLEERHEIFKSCSRTMSRNSVYNLFKHTSPTQNSQVYFFIIYGNSDNLTNYLVINNKAERFEPTKAQ